MKFIYCPKCGAKLEEKYSWDEGGVPYCVKDDLLFFDVPKPCIMVAVIKDDEVLLLKQSYIYKNSRVLISGYIGIDEKAEDTVHREVLEETGIKIDNVRFLGTEYVEGKELLMLTFMAFYKDGHILNVISMKKYINFSIFFIMLICPMNSWKMFWKELYKG